MAHPQVPAPPPPGAPQPGMTAPIPALPELNQPKSLPDAQAAFDTLRRAIAASTYDPELVLNAITDCARTLTGASGAALATRREGVVVCRARSGDTAPEVGARLSVDSGISGECLRTGKVLRCDDALKDYRTDPQVCRRLGLRSIAVVPLRGRRGVMGVLEAFSGKAYAFAEEHMNFLVTLAEIAEAARVRESGVPEAPPEVSAPPVHVPAPKLDPVAEISRESTAWARRRYWLGGTAVILLMLVVGGWRFWPKPAMRTALQTSVQAAAPNNAVTNSVPPPTEVVWKPSPAIAANTSRAVPSSTGVQRAAKIESVLAPAPQAAKDSVAVTPESSARTTSAGETQPLPEPLPTEAPKIALAQPDKAGLGNLISASPATMPTFTSPVSQGLTGGVLQHSVAPSYPTDAFAQHLEGSVVLQATINESGKVQDLKVMSGHPTLARAALDAVGQWRYSPYKLNGKPVAIQKTITVSFKSPR